MKKLLLICITLIAFSCAEKKDIKTDLSSIAYSKEYVLYQSLIQKSAEAVLLDEYDKDKVYALIDKVDKNSSCDFSEEDYKSIRGAKEYFDNGCKREQLVNVLDEKYGYRSLSDAESDQVDKLYEAKYPNDKFADKMFNKLVKK